MAARARIADRGRVNDGQPELLQFRRVSGADGFGIGDSSNLTWQAQGTLDYAFTESFIGRLGYRYMSIDYDAGPDLTLDMNVYGPMIGVTWAF